MTTTLQLSVCDMCYCYNNPTHTHYIKPHALNHTYQIDQTITLNHMQYNAWGVRDIDGYGCIVFEKDPRSVGPGVFNWRWVYSLGNHSMFLGLNYPIIQPIIDHITGDDYCAMQLPFARGAVFTHHIMGFMNHHI